MQYFQQVIKNYIERGFHPVPVDFQQKSCRLKDWPTLRMTPEQVPQFFGTEDRHNVGILLGTQPRSLIDVDLDCAEAIALAPYILPATEMIFGRESKPKSHWIYSVPEPGKTAKFEDGDIGIVVELRSTGSMTVFPGSVHEAGEEIRFDVDGEPAKIEFDELAPHTRRLAALSLILPHWRSGQRHELALALAGTFLIGGLDEEVSQRLMGALIHASGDREEEDRLWCLKSTLGRQRAGLPIVGPSRLADIIGERSTNSVCKWLGFKSTAIAGPDMGVGLSQAYGGPAPYSDTANAERFVAFCDNRACYLPYEKRWLVWRESNWTPDVGNARVQSLAIAAMRSMAMEAAETKDKEFQRFAMHSLDATPLKNLLFLAQGMCSADHEAFDADPWKLNCQSGIIDLQSGEIERHEPTKRMRKLAPVEFDTTAECPVFLGFLDRIFARDRELIGFIQRAVGYSLTGRTDEQCLFVLVGNGANGKSTLIRVLQEMLGDYAQQTPTDALMTAKAGAIPNDIARLEGARFVAAVEAEAGQRLAEAKIKQLTGGDRLAARFLYGELFEFGPQFKLWLATNRLPEVRGTDNGIWRRLCVIPFDVTIPEDERDGSLLDKLRAELPGILNWAIAGCLDWQKTSLRPPESVTSAGKAYRADMDTVLEFVEDRCVLQRGVEATMAALYEGYTGWCGLNGEQALSKREFGLRLKTLDSKKRGPARRESVEVSA